MRNDSVDDIDKGCDMTSRLVLMAAVLVQAVSCTSRDSRSVPSDREVEATPIVYVVNYPLEYFAERIGGQRVLVEFPAPPDIDPAFWMPDAAALAGFQAADLIIANGADYAKWLDKVTLPESRLIFTTDTFEDQLIRLDGAMTHTHGPTGEHSHAGTAFTTWLDATLAAQQAEAIREAFTAEWPEYGEEFQRGFDQLESDLVALDSVIGQVAAKDSGMPLLASHPVYQYLASRYGLNLRSVQWEPNEEPTPTMWRDLRGVLRDHAAEWMLWEDTPLVETTRQLRELGVESVVFDQCGNTPLQGDYLSVMHDNVVRLGAVFGRGD